MAQNRKIKKKQATKVWDAYPLFSKTIEVTWEWCALVTRAMHFFVSENIEIWIAISEIRYKLESWIKPIEKSTEVTNKNSSLKKQQL